MSSMFFIIFGILLDFTPKMHEIAIQGPKISTFSGPRTLLDGRREVRPPPPFPQN